MSLFKSRSQKNFYNQNQKFSLFQNYTNSTKFQTIFSNQTNLSNFFNNKNNNNSTFYNTQKYLNSNSGFNVFDINSKYKFDNLILFEKQKINKEKNKIFRHSTTKNLYKIEKKIQTETKIENERKLLNSKSSTKILNILSEMKMNFIKKKQEKFNISLIDNKNVFITANHKKINNEQNAIEYIKKINEIKLNKNEINIKKEIYKQIKENFEDKIELLDLKYKNLLRNKKILKNFNFNEFVRMYKNKKEIEKNVDLKLINKINELKNYNKNLNMKINKLKKEKNSILRWIFLQIKMKEKILEIPNYYKIIFDFNENEINNFILSNNKNNNNSYKKLNTSPIRKKSLIRNNSNILENNKNKTPKRINSIQNYNNNFYLLKGISNKEIIRILNYKKNLIFDCNEFFYNFTLFENSNLFYLNCYNEKISEIQELNKIKNLFLIEEKNNEKYETNLLNEFNNNLNLVKNIYKKLLKEKNIIENENNIKNNENNIIIKKNYNNHQKDFFNLKISSYNNNNLNNNNKYKNLISNIKKKIKKSKIYFKINFIYSNIIEFSNEKNINFNLNYNNNEILKILLKIENFINILLTKNQKYKLLFKEKYNFVKFGLDKKKKHKYINIQKEKDLKKEILMKQKIENSVNKLYFLPFKKISNYDIIFKHKKQKPTKSPSKKNFTFEDFMYDLE